MRIDANKSLMKTIVIGWNVLFAALNQMNENDQKIIANITATYVFTLLFNVLTFDLIAICRRANLILIFLILIQFRKKLIKHKLLYLPP